MVDRDKTKYELVLSGEGHRKTFHIASESDEAIIKEKLTDFNKARKCPSVKIKIYKINHKHNKEVLA